MLTSTIFREYEIRGIAGSELDDEYFQRHTGRRVALGRDTRLSSPCLRDALPRGLPASGCHVIDIGAVSAPVLTARSFT
jgi:phosphomannomutase